MTTPPEEMHSHNEDSTAPQPPESGLTARQIKAKKVQKWLDRGLNILLVVSVLMWVINHFFMPQAHEAEAAKKLDTLQAEAESAFGAAKKNDYSVTLQKPRPEFPAPAVAFMASDLDSIMTDMGERPNIIFFYASWCPYCHKMFPAIAKIAKEMQNKVRIIPVSIDEKPQAFIDYLAKHEPNPAFTPYVFADSGERLKSRDLLSKKGLHFKGAIPYMAVFRKGEALAQITGVLENDKLFKLVEDASTISNKTTITQPSSTINY
jgi:thiol-disulfide isomerase/thioredoxin